MNRLQQQAVRRPAPTSLAVGVVMGLVVVLLMTSLPLGARALVALVFAAVFAFTTYARWRPDGPGAKADLRRAAVGAACVVVGAVAALVLPLLR